MDKQIKYLIGVLAAIIISAYFLSLLSGIPNFIKDDIIAFLEAETEGEISFGKLSLWPLNRINVKNFKFKDRYGNNYAAEELSLDYSLNILQDAEIISVEFVELKDSLIEINQLSQRTEAEALNADQMPSELLQNGSDDNSDNLESNKKTEREALRTDQALSAGSLISEIKLPDYLENLKLNIRDSKLEVKLEKYNFSISGLQMGLTAEDADKFKLHLSSSLALNRAQLNSELILEELELDNLELKFSKNGRRNEIYLKTAAVEAADLAEYLPQQEFIYQGFKLSTDSFSAQAALKGSFLFAGSELRSYNSEVEISDLQAELEYSAGADLNLNPERNSESDGETDQQLLKTEHLIDLQIPKAVLLLEGPGLQAAVEPAEIIIDQNSLEAGFKFSEAGEFEISAAADDFSWNYDFLNPYLEKGDFDFELKAERRKDEALQAELSLEAFDILSSDIAVDKLAAEIKLEGEEIYFDSAQLDFAANGGADGGSLKLRGSYNLNRENYMLRAEGNRVELRDKTEKIMQNLEIQNEEIILDYYDKTAAGEADFLIDAAGIYGRDNELSAAGEFKLMGALAEDSTDFALSTSFWFYQDNLTLSAFEINSEYGQLDLSGDIDFSDQKLQLHYAGKNFNPVLINRLLEEDIAQLNNLNMMIDYFEGSITEDFNKPVLSLTAESAYLGYQNFEIYNFYLKSYYREGNLEINSLKADISRGQLSAEGIIENILNPQESSLELSAASQNLYFSDLEDSFNQPLPLSGELQIMLNTSGGLLDPEINLEIEADDTVLEADGSEYEFSQLNASIIRENGFFEIRNFSALQQDLEITADGRFSLAEGYDIGISMQGFEAARYLADIIPAERSPAGRLSLNGRLSGEIAEPLFAFSLSSQSLSFYDLDIEFLKNSFVFNPLEQSLNVEEFSFNLDQGNYRLSGQLSQLFSALKSDLDLSVSNAALENTFSKFVDIYPLAEDLILNGNLSIQGEGADLKALLDLEGSISQDSAAVFKLNGGIGEELDLSFSSEALPIYLASEEFEFNLELKSRLNMQGRLTGDISSPVLNLEHELSQIRLNQTEIKSLKGNIEFKDKKIIRADEKIEFSRGGSFEAAGEYDLATNQIDLDSNLNSLPVGFIMSFFPGDLGGEGQLNGEAYIAGSISSPELDGEIRLEGSRLQLGLSDEIRNYRGRLSLNNSGIAVREVNADYADGSFSITGNINPFAAENAWDLSLSGEKLHFKHGSLDGLFDADLAFKGELQKPLLSGDLDAYDFVITIPWEWPLPDSDSAEDSGGGAVLIPRLDLDIYAGQNVNVSSSNMDISVDTGELNLKFDNELDDPLRMQGSFSSTRGVFSYYNSRFRLVNGQVVFTPVDENDIPTISANARTYAGSREINISLNGPADDMRTSLSANPEMSEEEILNLLGTQGALGSALIGGEDIGIQTIIAQELIRIINAFLQEDVINPLESDFQSALALDRIEIDAYQYGLEREFALFLGKNITDKLYIEYARTFAEDEDEQNGEISFQYKLTDLTVFKGTYFGDQEYQFSIEAGFEF